MTVWLLVCPALEYRIRQALKDSEAPFPNQKGQPAQYRTAYWVFHYFRGLYLLRISGAEALVLNLAEQDRQLLRLLGRSYEAFYVRKCLGLRRMYDSGIILGHMAFGLSGL